MSKDSISLTDVANGLRRKEVRDLARLQYLLTKIDAIGLRLNVVGDYHELLDKNETSEHLHERWHFIVNSIDSLEGFLVGYEAGKKRSVE